MPEHNCQFLHSDSNIASFKKAMSDLELVVGEDKGRLSFVYIELCDKLLRRRGKRSPKPASMQLKAP